MILLLDKKNHLKEIEHNIAPPMKIAITIPVVGASGVCVYVAASHFAQEMSEHEILKNVKKVAEKLAIIN